MDPTTIYRRAHVPASPGHTRRRGAALDDALLDAAWDEVIAAGYAKLTIEGVAARAGTSKAVLYRRWRNRAELVVAAMRRRVVPIASEIPDTGELRGDVLQGCVRCATASSGSARTSCSG